MRCRHCSACSTASASSGHPAFKITSPSANAVNGVCGAGFRIIGQPAAMAGATLCATRFKGKLKGVIASTGPHRKSLHQSPAAFVAFGQIQRNALAAQPHGLFGSGLEGQHGAIHLCARHAHRLARFGHDQLREPLFLLNERGGHVLQNLAPLPARQSARAAQARHGMIARPGARRLAWPRSRGPPAPGPTASALPIASPSVHSLPHSKNPVCVPGRIFMVELLSLLTDGKAAGVELSEPLGRREFAENANRE